MRGETPTVYDVKHVTPPPPLVRKTILSQVQNKKAMRMEAMTKGSCTGCTYFIIQSKTDDHHVALTVLYIKLIIHTDSAVRAHAHVQKYDTYFSHMIEHYNGDHGSGKPKYRQHQRILYEMHLFQNPVEAR